MRRVWSLIVLTVLASLLCWAAALVGVRALAQSPAPPGAGAPPASAPAEPAPPSSSTTPEPPADERGSADNSVSFPVDI